MAYPTCREEDVARFEAQGFLVVADAVPLAHVAEFAERCGVILAKKEKLAFDWAWEKGTPKEERAFKIVQGSPTLVWPAVAQTQARRWMLAYAAALLRRPAEFWYDQYLAKPPRDGAVTEWHQDEAYWGRHLDDRGVTCWMPLQDVDERNGCMHFISGGHRDGVLRHHQPPHVQSDLLRCEPDIARAVACPIAVGAVTFHHGKTPHMTPANRTDGWRCAVTTHMRVVGTQGEGDHYPWKVYVNQLTGERFVPPTR